MGNIYKFVFLTVISLFLLPAPVFSQNLNSTVESGEWHSGFGFGTDGTVNALAGGPGGLLFAAGEFERAGALDARNIAVWNGEEWRNIGDLNNHAYSLYVDDFHLYVGGTFTSITTPGGSVIEAVRIARYDINTGEWSAMGRGFDHNVMALEMGSNNSLIAGGCFTNSGSTEFNKIARWNDGEWSAFTVGDEVYEFTGLPGGPGQCVDVIYNDEDTGELFVGGRFNLARIHDSEYEPAGGYRNTPVGGLVRWTGDDWQMVGGGTYKRNGQLSGLSGGSVFAIGRHPDSGRLYIGGAFDYLLDEELTDAGSLSRNNYIDANSFAYREEGRWHGAATSIDTGNPASDLARKSVQNMLFDGDRIYLFGSFYGRIRPHDQQHFDAGGVAVFSDTEETFLLDEDDNSILGRGAWSRGPGVSDGFRSTGIGVKAGDDIYIGGRFNAFHNGTTSGSLRDMDNITRWDGADFHQLGFGIDRKRIRVIRQAGDILYLGGDFQRAYAGSETYETPLAIGYNLRTGGFVPLGSGIARGSSSDAGVRDIVHDPATGDIYFGGEFSSGLHPEQDVVDSRNLLRWDGDRWHEVAALEGNSTGRPPGVNDMLRVDDWLYIAGYFSTIPGRGTNQHNLAQLDLSTGEFVPIDFPDGWSPDGSGFVSLAHDGEYLYAHALIHDDDKYASPTLFRMHRDSGTVKALNGRLGGDPPDISSSFIYQEGEFLYVAGSFSTFTQWDEDGGPIFRQAPENLMIVHPASDTWFYPPEGFVAPHRTRYIETSGGNFFYDDEEDGTAERNRAGGENRAGEGNRSAEEEGAGGENRAGRNSGSNETAGTGESADSEWQTAHSALTRDEIAVRSDAADTAGLTIANLGDELLEWSVSISYEPVDGFDLPDNLVAAASESGTTKGETASVIPLEIDPEETPTGIYRAVIDITTSDPQTENLEQRLAVTVNAVGIVTDPSPGTDSVDVETDTPLQFTPDEYADEITVYLGTDPVLGDDDIIYQGEPVAQLESSRYGGSLLWYRQYYWRVDQMNAVSEVKGEIRRFRTADDPGGGTWTAADLSVNGRLEKVHFANPFKGWMMSGDRVYRTGDGAQTLDKLEVGEDDGFRDLFFLDEKTGWVLGFDHIYRTDDGGAVWRALVEVPEDAPNTIYFIDEERGWMAGENGMLYRSGDGGESWSGIESGTGSHLQAIHFSDEQNGWAAGSDCTVIHTDNGGESWSEQFTGNSDGTWSGQSSGNSDGLWLGQTSGNSDGSLSEQTSGNDRAFRPEQSTGLGCSLYDVAFTDAQIGWAVGEHNLILHTDDGGDTWTVQNVLTSGTAPGNRTIRSSGATPGNRTTRSGWMTTGSATSRSGWTTTGSGTARSDWTTTSSSLRAVHIIDEQTAWVAGGNTDAKSVIMVTNDAGATWNGRFVPVEASLYDIHFMNRDRGWAAGHDGTLLTYLSPDAEEIDPALAETEDGESAADSLEVGKPDNEWLTYGDVAVSGAEIFTGGALMVAVETANTTDRSIYSRTGLYVDGELVQQQSSALEAGAEEKLRFYLQLDEPGTYEITVGPLDAADAGSEAAGKAGTEEAADAGSEAAGKAGTEEAANAGQEAAAKAGEIQSTNVEVVEAWSQFRFGLNNNTYSPVLRGPEGPAGEHWRFPVSGRMRSSPAVVDDIVYFGGGHRMHAVRIEEGDPLWSFETGNEVQSSPALSGDTLFFGSSDGNFYALNRNTGDSLWTYQAGAQIRSSPVVAGGLVYFGDLNPEGGLLHAVRTETGEAAWTFETGAGIFSSPALHDGILYFGSNDRHVYALQAVAGEMEPEERMIWRVNTGEPVIASPVVSDSIVFIGSGSYGGSGGSGNDGGSGGSGNDGGDGSYGGSGSSGSSGGSGGSGNDGGDGSYGGSGSDGDTYTEYGPGSIADNNGDGGGYFFALHAGAGEMEESERLLWSVDTGVHMPVSAAVRDSVVYFGTGDGVLHARRAGDGSGIWSRTIPGGGSGNTSGGVPGNVSLGHTSPVIAGDLLYIGNTAGSGGDRYIRSFDIETGDMVWEVKANDIHTTPAVIGDMLYVGSDHAGLVAVGPADAPAEEQVELAETYRLEQNYPNPFNPATTISFTIPEEVHVRLEVYNALGQSVEVLVDEVRSAGSHHAVFNAGGMASGVYLYRIQAGSYRDTRRMMFVK